MKSTRIATLFAALLLFAAACGASTVNAGGDDAGTDNGSGTDGGSTDNDPSENGLDLDGRAFWSTEVVDDGQPRELVAGTRISLDFGTGTLGVSAGCNSMGGAYTVDDGLLIVADLAMTEMGCDPERHAQDTFVADFLATSPAVTIDGDELRLASGETMIALLDTDVANPDVSIIGTVWEVNGFIDGDTAMAMATPTPGSVVFTDESSMIAYDGCKEYIVNVEVSDGSTGGPVEDDGEMQFGPVEFDTEGCEAPEYVEAFHASFETGEASYLIDGTQLTILNGGGAGLTLTAAE